MEGMECNHSAPYARLAVRFAEDLVAGRFEDAHSRLSVDLGEENDAAALRTVFEEMFEYAETQPTEVMLVSTMEEWPDQQSNDLGLAYVTVGGDGFSEAVSLIVEDEEGTLVIRCIEWGRP